MSDRADWGYEDDELSDHQDERWWAESLRDAGEMDEVHE
jgi:hypothetical protein